MSQRNRTPTLDRYDEALADVLAYVEHNGRLITAAGEAGKLRSTFVVGANLATLLIGDGVRSGLVRDFARRMRTHGNKLESRRVGHA